ncbi:DNA polymerase-3 subunit epsilon [Oceanospirillum multiglobuliferum]|uniref:DNA polymerase III subunit epsilon n=1 Tax=Oceanospirillum multiglobuliferum TaxID=64969 RepID=A0A1T4PZC2_9GAMM|nr:3'-5' exonuclease [Oceanospirillum multiglobuliferum]OPX55439.1 DNA polymerase III subunit epsilon [Oceanospirillum multiglobuliferum]SJZ96657.1 DNA polymerase-3 subunit epsilon [Oceanospirillum multiglobuliferum]
MLHLIPDQNRRKKVSTEWPERFQQLAEQAQHPLLKDFYSEGCVAPDTALDQVPFVAMDFETTGLNPQKNGIVSIGLVPFTLQRIYCGQSRHWILDPGKPLRAESVVIHGITHSDIDEAPDLSKVLPQLLQALKGRIVVVHHRGIEQPFLNAALKARLGEGLMFPVVDTMELEARLHRHHPLSWIARLIGRKPVSIRLADSRTRYNLPFYTPHHALTDALASAELLQAQVADRFKASDPISLIWH